MRLLYTMIRVANLNRSLAFYTDAMGMSLFRREDYPEGRFTLAFVGYGDETTSACLELTHNWDAEVYAKGDAWGHVAIGTSDLDGLCARLEAQGVPIVRRPGPMRFQSPQRTAQEVIAFIEDPDGYRIELVAAEVHELAEGGHRERPR